MISEEGELSDTESAETVLGSALKDAYVDFLGADDNAAETPFGELTIEVVEGVTRESADAVRDAYFRGSPPLFDDARKIAAEFVHRFTRRFGEALCAELQENADLSAWGKGMVVTLVPAVMFLLGLKPLHAALAIPISIVTARVAVRGLCQQYSARIRDRKFLEERLQLHRRRLLQLEGAMGEIADKSVRDVLSDSICVEEAKVESLEKEIQSIDHPSCT